MSRSTVALALVLLAGCTPPPSRSAAPSAAPATGVDLRTRGPHVRFQHATDEDLATQVRAFAAAARAEGRVPLVYVGATWCEPCQYFHAAAERGDLDAELPALALLELDLDRDGARIRDAGYASEMIPLFAVPGDDGRGTGRQIEGSIHGPASPLQIAPRLRALLSPTP
jgi:thiol-disulfide isomerase/thioredoxin